MNQITIEAFNTALNNAANRWARENNFPEGTKQNDISRAVKMLTAHTVEFVNTMCAGAKLDSAKLLQAIAEQMPVKANMRMVEYLNAVKSGDYSKLDPVTTLAILSYAYAGVTTRDGLHFVSTGKGDENTSDQVKNLELVRKLQRVLGRVGVTTEPTQLSRSFGKNGFCNVLGLGQMTRDEQGNKVFTVNVKHPLFKAVSKMIETATDATLELAFAPKRQKKA